MAKYRKRPVVVEAVQFTGTQESIDEVFRMGDLSDRPMTAEVSPTRLAIETLEGTMRADVGDWIIRGVKGECYPCKPDIFAATYEEVVADNAKPLRPIRKETP